MARVWGRLAAAVFSVSLVVGLVQCKMKPTAGGKCTSNGKYICTDLSNALLCANGTLVPLACRGPKGCQGTGVASECDDDLALAGDSCLSTLNESFACSVDHKTELVCKDNKFVVARTCKGPKSCTVTGDLIHCDDSQADIGDQCIAEPGDANYACTTDKKYEVVCQASTNKFEISNSCRGSKGCYIQNDMVYCDRTFGREGDICRPIDDHACGEDGHSELHCKQAGTVGKWSKQRDCKRGCQVKGNYVECD
jgi:hypothetical protein